MNKCIKLYTDVLIVGTGISGLYAALNLKSSIKALIITKSKINENNSYLAQGGITVAKDNKDISFHIEDTLRAGKYKNNREAVEVLSLESRENINALINFEVKFDKCGEKLDFTREAAHSINRILHVKDETGKTIIITADSIGIAIKNNIKIKNLEYIQFHPTAFHSGLPDTRRFLISESIRGEGGQLINAQGNRFVNELLPRDIVTDAILKELAKTGASHVYLNISFLNPEYIKGRFPYIYSQCLKKGIDITKDYIPVSPSQHYFMGGIEVDLNSKSSMENLYVVGESSCTGVHGANRLASNSLLEGLVFSRRAALHISKRFDMIELINVPFSRIFKYYPDLVTLNSSIAIKAFKRKGGKIANELVNC